MTYLVGDRFGAFAALGGAVTVSEAERDLPDRPILGQGISRERLAPLLERYPGRVELPDRWDDWEDYRATHKGVQEDVLIATPVESGGVYRSILLIDDRSTEMHDHVSDQVYLQGKVLIEAACQMAVSIVGHQYFGGRPSETTKFILEEIGASFDRFVLPLGVEIEQRLEGDRRVPKLGVPFVAETTFTQGGERVATIRVKGGVLERPLIAGMVARIAR